jgi:predicted MFS family arabinose efflux permease
MLVIAVGFGLLFVPLTLVAMSRVADEETGVAASLRNTGQQVGGSIGLAVFGTVAWTVVANSVHAQAARAAAAAARPATRRGPARQRSPRSTTTPWPPASPAPSWSRPASCCSA